MKRNPEINNAEIGSIPLQAVPGLDTSNQRRGMGVYYDPNSDIVAQESVNVNALLAERGPLHPGLYPGFQRITHPDFDMEVHRPTQNALIIGDKHSPIAATGRIFDATITSAKNTIDRLALFDGAFMPAALGMEANITDAKAAGRFSTYYSLVYRHTMGEDKVVREVPTSRDVFYVCTEEGGDLRIRSIISGDEAHTQDAMLQRGIVHDDGTVSYDRGVFVDYLSYKSDEVDAHHADTNQKFEKMFRSFGESTRQSDQDILQGFVTAMAAKILNPDYDYKGDKNLHKDAKYYISQILPGVLRGEYAASSPTHPYLRCSALLRELELYEGQHSLTLTPKGKKDIRLQRSRLLQSVVAAGAYLEIIGRSPKFDKEANDKRKFLAQEGIHQEGAPMNTSTGTGLRFEAVSLDETDRLISLQAKRALERMMDRKNDSPHHKALANAILHLAGKTNEMLQIRPKGGNKLAIFNSLSSEDGPESPSGSPHSYDGRGIAHGVWGHYPFEIPNSLMNPYSSSKRFAEAGLAMGGVVAVFDVVTPESEHEKHGPKTVRCIVLSGKQMPWCLQQALHKRTHSQNRKLTDLRDAIDGSFGIIEELERTRDQYWLAGRFGDDGVKMYPTPLKNGSAFAVARDKDGVLYEDFGIIPGQNPLQRSLYQPRDRSRNKPPVEPKYANSTRGKSDGLHNTKPGDALLETRFANGAVYISGTDSSPKLGIEVAVTPHFVTAMPNIRRNR